MMDDKIRHATSCHFQVSYCNASLRSSAEDIAVLEEAGAAWVHFGCRAAPLRRVGKSSARMAGKARGSASRQCRMGATPHLAQAPWPRTLCRPPLGRGAGMRRSLWEWETARTVQGNSQQRPWRTRAGIPP